jgi:hypothetical protein
MNVCRCHYIHKYSYSQDRTIGSHVVVRSARNWIFDEAGLSMGAPQVSSQWLPTSMVIFAFYAPSMRAKSVAGDSTQAFNVNFRPEHECNSQRVSALITYHCLVVNRRRVILLSA